MLVYLGLRIGLGLILRTCLAAIVLFRDVLPLQDAAKGALAQLGTTHLLMGFALVIMIGFYGPAFWLASRARDRAAW